MKIRFDWIIPAAVIALMLAFAVGVVLIGAHFEANSYRKFCGTPVTTWDAVWLDLRIDECACEGD